MMILFNYNKSSISILYKSHGTANERRVQKLLAICCSSASFFSVSCMSDLTKWRLNVCEGRQVWKYEEEGNDDQSFAEKYFLALHSSDDTKQEENLPTETTADYVHKGIQFYGKLQLEDGHWGNDYGGPMFLLPGFVITYYITGVEIVEEKKIQIIRYLTNTQREDGGWGLHIESPSTMFGSALTYVALRLLGMSPNHDVTSSGKKWIRNHGGAEGIPSWGKFWLAALNVYDWRGVNPIPPEFWLLPYWTPVHPGKWWCHCRMVYLPMGYIYGKKSTAPLTPLLIALRSELYESYESIDWPTMGSNVCEIDIYTPHTLLVQLEHTATRFYERWHSTWLRKKACEEVMEQINAEDRNTNFINIGPVNKVLNMLCVFYHEGKDSPSFQKHVDRLDDYWWLGRDGMKVQGYNGSQLWDTAFSAQAIIHGGMVGSYKELVQKIYSYVDISQVREEVPTPERHYRHISVGAWPFSTRDHGWPISDCTAEGLKTILSLNQMDPNVFTPTERVSDDRIFNAVNVLLSLQNSGSGGWASYERTRTGAWLERINPSETFYGIMVDHPYVECSSATIQALVMFQEYYPSHRASEIKKSIRAGIKFIEGIQRDDGSWRGSWAVCFTYATWFGVEALVAVGETLETSPALRKACEFLLVMQNEDGGWGESFESCVKMDYIPHPDGSQVVNTAWALIALQLAQSNQEAIDRGIAYLCAKQLKNGDWEQEGVSGVFNANCAISYSSYKNVFPLWALGMSVSHKK